MKIFIDAHPGAKQEEIEKINETHFKISVKEPPIKGRANEAIIKALSGYFNVSRMNIKIISGQFSRNKIIEINYGK